jgi:hypothetical protein
LVWLWCKLKPTVRSVRLRLIECCEGDQAASAAFHSPVIVGMGMRGDGRGGRGAANAPADNAPMLFVFTLDGKAEIPKPTPPTPAR